jgi:uncharacterized short protein YbdD (DUF466 family)
MKETDKTYVMILDPAEFILKKDLKEEMDRLVGVDQDYHRNIRFMSSTNPELLKITERIEAIESKIAFFDYILTHF